MKDVTLVLMLILVGLALAGCPSTTTTINFNNLSSVTSASPAPTPVNVGDRFSVGDVLIENTSNVKIAVLPFQWSTATPNPPCPPGWTADGYVEVVAAGQAGGTGAEIRFNNATLGVIAPSGKTVTALETKFNDAGGNVNLLVNGSLANGDSFAAMTAPFPGVNLTVVPPGAQTGTLRFSGDMKPFNFTFPCPASLPANQYSAVVGGGQELWIDDLTFSAP